MQGTPRQNAAALLVVCLILAAVGGRLWATHAGSRLQGPRYVAADAAGAVVEFDRRLHRFDAEGRLRATVALDALGIDGTPVGLQLLRDGSVLIGDLEARAILRCRLDSRHCERIGPADRMAIAQQFKFHLDETAGRLYFTDTGRHRLLAQDLASGRLTELSETQALCFPNGLTMDGDGRLLVADTNSHRIAYVATDPDTASSFAGIAAHSDLARRGRQWPVAVAVDGERRVWALNADGRLAHADLVVYRDRRAERRIALPANADPSALAVLGGTVLVADPGRVALYAVDAATGAVAPFGDPAFQAVLAERAERKRGFAWLDRAALALLVVGVLAMLALVVQIVRGGERVPAGAVTLLGRPAAALAGVVWVPRNPDTLAKLRRTRRLVLWLIVLPVLLMGGLLAVEHAGGGVSLWQGLLRFGPLLGLAFVLVIGTGLGSWWLLAHLARTGIGTDGEFVYLQDSAGRVTKAAPEAVLHNARLVACGGVSVPLLFGQFGPAFEPQAFYRDVYPLLARGRKASELHLLAYQVVNGHPAGWFSLAALVAAATMLVLVVLA